LNRILVIRLKAIGDVLFTLPAVEALRRAHPRARIDFLTGAPTRALANRFPGIHQVHCLDRSRIGWAQPFSTLATLSSLTRNLRSAHYDCVVDLHGLWETAWISRLTGAPQRWGWHDCDQQRLPYTHRESVLRRPGVIVTANPQGEQEWHPSDWHLELLRRRGIPRPDSFPLLSLPNDAVAEATRFLDSLQLAPGTLTLFLQPFASSIRKDWPLTHYLQIAHRWRLRGCCVIFGGSPVERPRLTQVIEEGFPVAAGLSLLAMAALMRLCNLCVSSDSGPIHIGHAAGAHILVLRQFKNVWPWREPENAITASALNPVSSIDPGPVDEAILARLDPARSTPHPAQATPR
jgi:ADP-heptose:LPS heptosyltransferase